MEPRQFDKFIAKFNPTKTDDLQPHLFKFIGKAMTFQYAWIMDDDEQFPGVWACTCREEGFYEWVPEFDLDKI